MKLEIPYPIVLNELSIAPPTDLCEFAQRLDILIRVIEAMVKVGFSRRLVYVKALVEQCGCQGGGIRDWIIRLNSTGGKYRELSSLVLRLFSSNVFIEEYMTVFPEKEFLYKGRDVSRAAFGFSCVTGLPSISFQLAEFASQTQFDIEVREMTESGEVEQSVDKVVSVSSSEQCFVEFNRIIQKIVRKVSSGEDLLKYSAELLPRVRFSQTARHQLKQVNRSAFTANGFLWICKSLLWCNQCAVRRHANNDLDFFRMLKAIPLTVANGESESSRHGRYREARAFIWCDGSSRVCCAHIKNMGLNLRVYFDYDNYEDIVYIGHIGDHLPIQSGNY